MSELDATSSVELILKSNVCRFPGAPILVREDNLGLVRIAEKGMSKCRWCWTVAKAVMDLGNATGTRIKFLKVGRCSEEGDVVADLLSKGKVSEFK